MEYSREIVKTLETDIVGALPSEIPVSDDLTLRKITPEDAPALFQLAHDNPDIPTQTAWAKDVHSVEDVIPSLQARSNETMDGRYVITHEGQVVGSIWAFAGEQAGEFGVGYCLVASARGQGFATQAVSAVLEQLKLLGAQQVYFQINASNTDSIALPRRLGCAPAETLMGVDFPVEQQRWRLDILP